MMASSVTPSAQHCRACRPFTTSSAACVPRTTADRAAASGRDLQTDEVAVVTKGAVDLKVVRDRLEIVAVCLADLRTLPQSSVEEFLGDRRNPAAADSLLRRAIEALFDSARHLLARVLDSEPSSIAMSLAGWSSTVCWCPAPSKDGPAARAIGIDSSRGSSKG